MILTNQIMFYIIILCCFVIGAGIAFLLPIPKTEAKGD